MSSTLVRDNATLNINVYNNNRLLVLHFAWGIAVANCILATAVYVSVCLSVCLSLAAFSHYCTDPDATWGNGRGAL